MTDLIQQYLETCAAARAEPESELLRILEEKLELPVHEEIYPSESLLEEIDLYRRIAAEAEHKVRAERIIDYLEHLKEKIALRSFDFRFEELDKLGSLRRDKIRQVIGKEIELIYISDFFSIGGDLCKIELKQYVTAFSDEILCVSPYSKRVRTLNAAQEAGKSLNAMFGVSFEVSHGILVKDDFDHEIQELSEEMANYETQVIEYVKQEFSGHEIIAQHFREVFVCYGMFRRKAIEQGVLSLAEPVLKAFLQINCKFHEQPIDGALEELSLYQFDVQIAFETVESLFSEGALFPEVSAYYTHLQETLEEERVAIVSRSESQIANIIVDYEPENCLFFDESMGRAFGRFPQGIEKIYDIIIALERYGLKLERTTDYDKIKLVLQSYPAVLSFSNLAGYYNLLYLQQPPFALQLLKPQIEKFQIELEKCAQASTFKFDPNVVEELLKIGRYGDNLMKSFQSGKMERIYEFERKWRGQIMLLASISLEQRELWRERIESMRHLVLGMRDNCSSDEYEILTQYASACVIHIASSRYSVFLLRYCPESNDERLRMTADLLFEMPKSKFIGILADEYNVHANILTPEYSFSGTETFDDLENAFISRHIRAYSRFLAVADLIYSLECNLQTKYGGPLFLEQEKSDALCAEVCATYESCYELYEYAVLLTKSPCDELYFMSPELQPINEMKGLFKLHGFDVDLSEALVTLQSMPLLLEGIAISASSYLTSTLSHLLLQEVELFSEKTQQLSSATASSKQLAELKAYIDKSEVHVLNDLSALYKEMRNFQSLLVWESNQCQNIIGIAEMCGQQYILLCNNMEGAGALILEKKKLIELRIADDTTVLTDTCSVVLSNYSARLLEGSNFFRQCTKLTADNEIPLLLTHLSLKGSAFESECKQLLAVNQEIAAVQVKIETANEEMQLLFGKEYLDNLNEQEKVQATDVLSLKQATQAISILTDSFQEVFVIIDELSDSDWPSLKTRFDLFELFEAKNTVLEEEAAKLLEMLSTQSSMYKSLIDFEESIQECCSILNETMEFMISIIKMLKTPVMAKQHWLEIIERNEMQTFIKMHAGTNESMSSIPDSIMGAAVFAFILSIMNSVNMREREIEFEKICREIVIRAENEQSIRSAVDEVQFYLESEAKVQMTLIRLSDLSIEELTEIGDIRVLPTTASWKPILTALSEKKEVLASISTSPYAKFLSSAIEENNAAIEAITEFALIETQVGRELSVLEPVIARKVLVNEERRFYQAVKVVASVFIDEEENSLVLGFLRETIQESIMLEPLSEFESLGGYKTVVQELEAAGSLLEEVETALRIYLEEKRLIFPRFYFLADSDVLEVLASATEFPQLINNHIKKMFSAVEHLSIDGNRVQEFHSTEGEIVELKEEVIIEDNPEIWLGVLDTSIKMALKLELLECLKLMDKIPNSNTICESYSEVKGANPLKLGKLFIGVEDITEAMKEELDISKYSGEILTIALAVQFTAQVDYALTSQDTDALLVKIEGRYKQYLKVFSDELYSPAISESNYGSPEYILQLKLKQLATDTTHFIAVVEKLLGDKEKREWIWNRELKYRIYAQTGDLYLIALDTFLPYTFEYEGLPARLIHTELTDRCYSTLTLALSCAISSNPEGPAGTGKTESVKAYCSKLGRPCIVFNCDSAIDREDLSRILIGIILSGSVGCFDEINRLSPSVLSAVSADIEDVERAINRRSMNEGLDSEFSLSGISVPLVKVSPFSAIFVTMNPASREYRGRSELPFSLIKLLRPCFMGKADTSVIMETILSTTGFAYAKIWAIKVDLTYALASHRIPKEVHLDWGLRSLQAVLREAALSRAALKNNSGDDGDEEALERRVIIKALSDATFSRVEGVSRTIFQEILIDVFGAVETSTNKFGATNELEEKLADKIQANERIGCLAMELFRALIAKTGVALLGNSAAGKTHVREVLKKAIFDASNGFIEVREFLISPKAMSRSELLGFVDPQTKEWNEGALTLAARQAVSLLANTSKPFIWPIVVFDGDIDPMWIESLNSSLDDNRLLSLSSGERIRFPMSLNPLEAYYSNAKLMNSQGGTNMRMDYKIPTPVSFLFETDSLENASPATVSRLAVILVADPSVEEHFDIIKEMDSHLCATMQCLDVNEYNLSFIAVQMHMGGVGERKNGGPYELGAIRTLYNWYKKLDLSKYEHLAGKFEYELEKGDIVSPNFESNENSSSRQSWEISVIKSFINGGYSVLLSGKAETGKYYCLEQALDSESTDLFVIACTNLTTREDIMRQLCSSCEEYQRGDGQKVMKPKSSGKRTVLFIRNADIVPYDEYGHSELFSFIWSMVAHEKVYLRGGIDCILEDIIVVVSVERYDLVPNRLKRYMGTVHFDPFVEEDYKFVLPSLSEEYSRLIMQANLSQWLQEEVERAEISESRGTELQLSFNIALPNYLKLVDRIPISRLIDVSRLKLDLPHVFTVMEYLLTAPIPCAEGKRAALQDMAILGEQPPLYPTLFSEKGIRAHIKFLEEGVQSEEGPSLSFISEVERLQQIAICCKELGELYPCLRCFMPLLENLSNIDRTQILYNLSAIELSIYLSNGVLIYSEPDNFSLESVVLALSTADFAIRFMNSDRLTTSIMKTLLDEVAHGMTRVAVIIDENTLMADGEWVQFIAALASENSEYFLSKVSMADLRSLTSIYQEKMELSDDISDVELQQSFLELVLESITPVIFINPEHKCADQLLINAPPLRRQYCTVFYELLESNKATPITLAEFEASGDTKCEILNALAPLLDAHFERNEPLGSFAQISDYTKSLLIQQFFEAEWEKETQHRRLELQTGLKELHAAQNEVDKLAKEATERKLSVELAEKEANEALEEITSKIKIVEDSKEESSIMEKELQQNELIAKQEYDEANHELSTVEPILEEAAVAVSQIPNDALTEVKSFKNPPPAVAVVLEAVLSFMGESDVSWGGMRSFLSENGILRQIAGLDIKNVSSQWLKKVIQITEQHPECFVQERIYKVSRAAAPLALWVTASLQYAEVYVKVEPLMQKARAADDALTTLRKQLETTEEAIERLEEETEILRLNFDRKTKDLIEFQNELKLIEIRKARGDEMLASLQNERVRWTENEISTSEELDEIVSASVYVSAMYVCVGKSSDDVREHFCGPRRRLFNRLLATEEFCDEARAAGLRLSDEAIENAACIAELRKEPGIIGFAISHVTDSTGALEWLVRETNAEIVSATNENLANFLAIAARFGESVIVTDCDNGFVPPAATPYLRYGASCYQKSEQSSEEDGQPAHSFVPPQCTLLVQNSSGRPGEFICHFRVFLVSSVSLKLPADLRGRVIELSFAPTERSRTDFYVDKIMQEWSPNTLKEMEETAEVEASLRTALVRVEESLLLALEESANSPNILEDENLIRVLRDANVESEKIRQTEEKTELLLAELNDKRGKATMVAEVVARSMQALESISNINELYVADDSVIVPLLIEVLEMNKNDNFDENISEKTVQDYLSLLYTRISTMVFSPDLVGAASLLLRYCSGLFTQELFNYVTGKFDSPINTEVPSWAELHEREFKLLAGALGQDLEFCLFTDSAWGVLAEKISSWKEIDLHEFPDLAKKLNVLEKVLIVTMLRPDLLNQGFELVCEECFGLPKKIEDPVQEALRLTSGLCQPILIYTSSGQDPTNTLVGSTIAIAPGREHEADEELLHLLEKAGREMSNDSTSLIIIKGAHLCSEWLAVLPSRLQEYSTSFAAKYDMGFAHCVRIVLVLESRAGFPRNLSRTGWRIHLSSRGNARTSFIELLGQIETPNGGIAVGSYFSLAYTLSALHAVMETRREFAPRGVACDPGWSAEDLIALCETLRRMAETGTDCDLLVNRARGLIVDAVYGVASRDECDLELVKALSEAVLTESFCHLISVAPTQEVASEQEVEKYFMENSEMAKTVQRLPFIKFVLPPLSIAYLSSNPIQDLETYALRAFPEITSSDVLALPPNALISRGEKDSLVFRSILQRSEDEERSAEEGSYYMRAEELCDYFDTLHIELTSPLPTDASAKDSSPLATELQHQADSIEKIAMIIKEDLDIVRFAANNPLLASPRAKEIAEYINNNITPEHWTKNFQSPPTSIAPLDFPDLVLLREGSPMDFLRLLPKAFRTCTAPATGNLELSIVPRPPALLEAVRRELAVEKHVELDEIELYGEVGGKSRIFIDAGQMMLQGAMLQPNGKLDYLENSCMLDTVAIHAGQKRDGIPFYVDKDRELRMPVLDCIASEEDISNVIIAGVYLHLVDR